MSPVGVTCCRTALTTRMKLDVVSDAVQSDGA